MFTVTRFVAPKSIVFPATAILPQIATSQSVATINSLNSVKQFSTCSVVAHQPRFCSSSQNQKQYQNTNSGLGQSSISSRSFGSLQRPSIANSFSCSKLNFHTSSVCQLKETKSATASKTSEKRSTPRRKRDKNAPKRPLYPYIIFSTESRPKIVQENPSLSFTDIGRIIGEKWRALSAEDKKVYEKKSEADKERYKLEMEEYSKTKKAAFE